MQYDPRSRPTFVEISQKLELLLDKLDKPIDDPKNGKKMMPTTTNKRYSIDNYCSNWLSCSVNKTPQNNDTDESSTAIIATVNNDINQASQYNNPTTPQNDYENNQMHAYQQTNNCNNNSNLHHRRSLSENIIPFPPHTTPSDKARCHLINRRNSHLNADSDTFDESSSPPNGASGENDVDVPIGGIFCNTTLRKVAETMFLKDPQYKPHMSQTYGKSNPFETLTQLKGVKKIIGTSPATYTSGVCDLFSSCFEIRSTKDSNGSPQRNSTGKSMGKTVQQAKSLPSSPKITQRKLQAKLNDQQQQRCGIPNNINSSTPIATNDNKLLLFNAKAKNSDKMKNLIKMDLLDVSTPNQCQTPNSTDTKNNLINDYGTLDLMSNSIGCGGNTITGGIANISRTGTLKKKNASSLYSHPLFKCKEGDQNGRGGDDSTSGYFIEHPKLLRGGSSESGFFSCLTDDDFSTHHHRPLAKLSINGPGDYDSTLQYMDERSTTIPCCSLRSFDDFDLFERNSKFDCSANDSLSIDMGLVNRLSLDSEINSLFHKNQLNNQLLYCKNRTSSIYTDSSEDISSLAGSDSLLWDDRMSTYSTTIPNTRSAQIAKIVEYFERKGQTFNKNNSNNMNTVAAGIGGSNSTIISDDCRNNISSISSNDYSTVSARAYYPCSIRNNSQSMNYLCASNDDGDSMCNHTSEQKQQQKMTQQSIALLQSQHQQKEQKKRIDVGNSTAIDSDGMNRSPLITNQSAMSIPYQSQNPLSITSKEYEAFCLDKSLSTPQRLNVCEGVVKSKLQLFDKLRNN